jgi:hypothetical protein
MNSEFIAFGTTIEVGPGPNDGVVSGFVLRILPKPLLEVAQTHVAMLRLYFESAEFQGFYTTVTPIEENAGGIDVTFSIDYTLLDTIFERILETHITRKLGGLSSGIEWKKSTSPVQDYVWTQETTLNDVTFRDARRLSYCIMKLIECSDMNNISTGVDSGWNLKNDDTREEGFFEVEFNMAHMEWKLTVDLTQGDHPNIKLSNRPMKGYVLQEINPDM